MTGDISLLTMNWSVYIQIATGLVNVYGLLLSETNPMLRSILKWETGVQVIQLTFYVLALRYFYEINTIASMRYMDWVITTPIMLLTIGGYMKYIQSKSGDSMSEFINKNGDILKKIVIYNFLMLLFGYLGEVGYMDFSLATTLGFIFFFLSFYTLYTGFAKENDEARNVFWIVFVVWSLYGVAAWLPKVEKNVSFNILDIFAKNAFGLFITYKVIQSRFESKKIN